MFGHVPELIVVLVVAIVIFGPRRLPEIGGSFGKTLKAFRKEHAAPDDDESQRKLPDQAG